MKIQLSQHSFVNKRGLKFKKSNTSQLIMAQNIPSNHFPLNGPPFRECLEREVFLSVQTWKEEPRLDLRQYRDNYPTPKGCILNASRWAILRDHLMELSEEMHMVQSGSTDVKYKIYLGGNIFAEIQ